MDKSTAIERDTMAWSILSEPRFEMKITLPLNSKHCGSSSSRISERHEITRREYESNAPFKRLRETGSFNTESQSSNTITPSRLSYNVRYKPLGVE